MKLYWSVLSFIVLFSSLSCQNKSKGTHQMASDDEVDRITHDRLMGTYGYFDKNNEYQELLFSEDEITPYTLAMGVMVSKNYRFTADNETELTFYWQGEAYVSKQTLDVLDDGRIKCTIYPPNNVNADSLGIEPMIDYLYPIDESEITIEDIYDPVAKKFDMSREHEVSLNFQRREMAFRQMYDRQLLFTKQTTLNSKKLQFGPADFDHQDNMQRLYIDIDGVLLTKRLPEKAQGADPFIDFVTRNFECFWLTTHCKGNSLTAINYLKKYMGAHTMDLVTRLKPTNWDTLKTEAIDTSTDYYWLDDVPLQVETEFMRRIGRLHRLILVDLARENELERIKGELLTHLERSK